MIRFATLKVQCWLFAIGSTLFALATIPGFSGFGSAGTSTTLCFIGSWFFTSAALVQLVRSDRASRNEWLCAVTQLAGTFAFNISTGFAVWAHATRVIRGLVWTPDAAGSIAFLASGVFGVLAVGASTGWLAVKSRDWQADWINLVGCVAFGISAVGSYVSKTGATVDAVAANLGTFLGALCFLVAALLVLPGRERRNS